MPLDDFSDDMEAIGSARLDAGLELAGLNAAGNAARRAERAGVCTHSGAVWYRNPPLYPEQHGLKPGQIRCLACKQVYDSEDSYRAAVQDAIEEFL